MREKMSEGTRGAGEWIQLKGQETPDKNGGARRWPLGKFTPARRFHTKCGGTFFSSYSELWQEVY